VGGVIVITAFKVNQLLLLIPTLTLFAINAQHASAQSNEKTRTEPITQVRPCRNGPLEKNLNALNTTLCNTQIAAPRELSMRQLRKLGASLNSPEGHLKLAGYYRNRADRLEARAAAYRNAAARLGQGPQVKNLTAPGTAERYRFLEKQLHDEAVLQRTKADSEDRIAKAETVSKQFGSF
jgi:hypothetical protein